MCARGCGCFIYITMIQIGVDGLWRRWHHVISPLTDRPTAIINVNVINSKHVLTHSLRLSPLHSSRLR